MTFLRHINMIKLCNSEVSAHHCQVKNTNIEMSACREDFILKLAPVCQQEACELYCFMQIRAPQSNQSR